MTPTREQAFDQWFAERYPDTTSVYSEFKSTTVRDLMREAHAAGREQGLREAKEAVSSKTHHPDDPDNCVWTAAYDHVAAEHAAAIEQLRAK